MITPTDHVRKSRGVTLSPHIRRKSSDKASAARSRGAVNANASSLFRPVPSHAKKSPKHSLYPTNVNCDDVKRHVTVDGVPERSRHRSQNVHQVAKPAGSCSHPVILPPIHRRSNFLTGTDDMGGRSSLPAPRPLCSDSWMTSSSDVSPFVSASASGDAHRIRSRRKVAFRSESPQIIGDPITPRSIRIRPSPRIPIKSILKKQHRDKPEVNNPWDDERRESGRLPNIERTGYRSAGRFRNSATRWRGRTRTSPGISFTCSKEFAKVFENLEKGGELADIHWKGGHM